VPHVLADNFKGAGFGYGYAFAQQNVCLYAEELVTLRGERAQYFGATGGYLGQLGTISGNVDSDFFYKLLLTKAQADRIGQLQPGGPRHRGGLCGRLQPLPGRHRRGQSAGRMPQRRLGQADERGRGLLRLTQAAMAGSSMAFINSIGNAGPPGLWPWPCPEEPASRRSCPARPQLAASPTVVARCRTCSDHTIGSNGYGLGKDVTQSGKGIVMGNPHFPWWGALRLHQMHITVPNEKYDVMGATLLGVPLPLIGFNSTLGWTHTFSTDNRFTLRYLALDPANPTRYIKDGVSKPMTAVPLSISAKGADGKLITLSRTLYTTEFGPMIMDSSFAWSAGSAFAIQDANYSNYKLIDQVILNGKATSVDGLLQAAATHTAMPWVNTMAADKNGDAMYFNYSVAAKVANAQLDACVPGPSRGALQGPDGQHRPGRDGRHHGGLRLVRQHRGQRPALRQAQRLHRQRQRQPLVVHGAGLPDRLSPDHRHRAGRRRLAPGRTHPHRPRHRARPAGRRRWPDGQPLHRGQPAADLPEEPLLQGREVVARLRGSLPGQHQRVGGRQGCLHRAQGLGQGPRAAELGCGAVLRVLCRPGRTEEPLVVVGAVQAGRPAGNAARHAGTAEALAKLEALVASTQFDSPAKRRARPADVQVLSRPEGPLSIPAAATPSTTGAARRPRWRRAASSTPATRRPTPAPTATATCSS
jgi:hypothetical protein